MGLSEVHAALDAGDWNAALGALLGVWRGTRAVEIEAAITALSDAVTRGLQPIPAGDEEAWATIAHELRPIDLPRLLVGLDADPASRIPGRVAAIARFGGDPRIGPKYLAMIDGPPTTSTSNQAAWVVLFAHLPACVDTRAAGFLEAKAAVKGGASQFWGRLQRWCATAGAALVDPAPLPADLASGLPALLARIDALATGPAPVVPPVTRTTAGATELPSLAAGADALAQHDLATAMDALVGFWAHHRTGEVGDLVDRLDALLEPLPLPGTTPKARNEAWLERARSPRPSEVGALLATASEGKASDLEERLELMLAWPPDPRVYRYAESHFPTFHIGARKRFWTSVHDLLVRCADPRRAEAFEERVQRHRDPRPAQRYAEIRRQVQRTEAAHRAALAGVVAPKGHPRATLDAFASALSALGARSEASAANAREREEALVRAIAADPTSDDARLVYGDWLLDHGQPERGELVQLEIRLAAGAKVKSRRDKLLKALPALLGPIEPITGSMVRHEMGMLIEVPRATLRRLDHLGQAERDAALTDLRWATVQVLGTDFTARLSELFARAPLWSLRKLRQGTIGMLAGLAERDDPIPLRSVEILVSDVPSDDDWARLDAAAPQVPELQEVHYMGWQQSERSVPPLDFFASPLLAPVQVLADGYENGAAGGTTPLPTWLARMSAARCPVPRLVTWDHALGFEARLRPDGRYDVKGTVVGLRGEHELEPVGARLRQARAADRVASFEIVPGPRCAPELFERLLAGP